MMALSLVFIIFFCFLIKGIANLVFKPLTARWFSIGLSSSITLGHLLFLTLMHLIIENNKTAYELVIFTALTTWLLSLVALNLLVLPALYWWDKRLASRNNDATRIPENALHTLVFMGGYIGAWIGQKSFHHKVSKREFQIKHYVICILSMSVYGLIGYWFYLR